MKEKRYDNKSQIGALRSLSIEKPGSLVSRLDVKAAGLQVEEETTTYTAGRNLFNSQAVTTTNSNKPLARKRAPATFIPRTGIELPYMIDRPIFKWKQREFEPCHCTNPCIAEEFSRLDAERLQSQSDVAKVVFDCQDPSPYYDSCGEAYFDETEAVEIPTDDAQFDLKKYPYGPTVPNQIHSQNLNSRGARINRWFYTLKPFYRL